MSERSKFAASFEDWLGILPNASPHRLKAGAAQEQTNLRVHVPGRAEVRGGLRPLTFTNGTTAVTDEIQAMHGFTRADARWVVYQTTAGDLKAGKNPSI